MSDEPFVSGTHDTWTSGNQSIPEQSGEPLAEEMFDLTPEVLTEKRKEIRQAIENEIDEFIKQVGYANPADLTDEQGWRWFEYGSANGRAGVVESRVDQELFLRAESLVAKLPADQEAALPLMQKLLESNLDIAGSARFGIVGENVFVCATIPVAELVPEDIPNFIHSVMALADSFSRGAQGTNEKENEQAPVPSADAEAT